MKKIAVVVPTINRKETLRVCLETLAKQTYKDFSIYVVSNASSDGTESMVKKDFPKVTVLSFKEMLGSAGAYKAGLEKAYQDGFDWFWLMDDDVWSDSRALEILVKDSSLSNKRVFASVCMDEKKSGNMAWSNDLLTDGQKRTAVTYKDLGKEALVESAGIGYLGLFLPREVVKKIGYPDEKMFAWVDDVDYYLRIKEAGFRMFFVRGSLIYHPKAVYQEVNLLYKKVQMARFAPWKDYYTIRNGIYLWMKHHSKLKTIFFKVPKQILLYSVVLIFYRDKKLQCFRYYSLAFYHGVTMKMGLRVLPA